MGKDNSDKFNTKFASYEEIPNLPEKRKIIFTVMATVGEAEKIIIPDCSTKSVDAIRVAFFKPDIKRTMELCTVIKSKGYKLFLQAMATYMYSRRELEDLLRQVAIIKADAFYLVDSFGTLYPEDLREMVKVVNDVLDSSIPVGFHAHNNIQLAFANDIVFLEEMIKSERKNVFLDATVYGMGRGAGNTPLELLASFLNKTYGCNYNVDAILDTYLSIISSKYRENYWGYDYLYYLSSKCKVNMAYIWYIKEIKGIKDEKTVGELIRKIPEEQRYTLNKDIVNEFVEAINGR